MTYVASLHNAYKDTVFLIVKLEGTQLSKLRIPADPRIVSRALSTYKPLKLRVAKDVPKSIRNIGTSLDRVA